MGLFNPPIEVRLTPEEMTAFAACGVRDDELGGWAGFYRDLRDKLVQGFGGMALEDEELVKCQRYAYHYGSGGWQNAFRQVLKAAQRAGWQPVED